MTRYDIINLLIAKHKYTRYLEIGVEGGESFNAVRCETKHGVDPASINATFKITSDEFFYMIHPDFKYDIVFVDGMHTAEQSIKDIFNALNHLTMGGTIVVHDCNPPTEWHQRSYEEYMNHPMEWNGDVWKSIVTLRCKYPCYNVSVVDDDCGCGIIQMGHQDEVELPRAELTYDMLAANRTEWLNLISVEEFLAKYMWRQQ